LSLLWLLLAKLSKSKQLSWLILVVFYLPQLSPEVHKDTPANEIWQSTEKFRQDYKEASTYAIGLAKYLASKHPEFMKELKNLEGHFLDMCSRLHTLEKKPGRVVSNKSFHSLCLPQAL
jgi:hypothetical protein